MLCVFKRRGYSEGESRWGGMSQNEVVGLGFSPHVADLSGDLSAGTGRYTGGLTFDGQMTAG